jgi:hypothetical protein
MTDLDVNYQKLFRTTKGRFSFDAKTVEELTLWQRTFRPELEKALGLDLMQEELAQHKPHAELLQSEPVEDYVRESWQIWVEPSLALPFYLLKPQAARGPLPLVLTPHGHNHPHLYAGIYTSEEEKKSIAEGDRDIAVQAVREGYIAIAPTTRGFGATRTETAIKENHTCLHVARN